MPARPTILIRTGPNDNRDWRRFVAILCFIEFYCQFVTSGHDVWNELHQTSDTRVHFDAARSLYLLELSAQWLRACALFLVGRALWRQKPTIARWTIASVALSIGVIAARVAQSWADQDPFFSPGSVTGFWPRFWQIFAAQVEHLIWLAILLVCVVHARRPISPVPGLNLWVVLAITWIIARLCVDCTPLYPHPGMPDGFWRETGLGVWIGEGFVGVFGPPQRTAMAYAAILAPLSLATLLFVRSRYARIGALLVACLDAAPIAVWVPVWPLLFYSNTQAMFNALPGFVPNPHSLASMFLNRLTFLTVCVNLVGSVAPWLVIAHYSLRKPLTTLPDDGSPWPRRYCARCFYNLHGVESDRCPECGEELIGGYSGHAASKSALLSVDS